MRRVILSLGLGLCFQSAIQAQTASGTGQQLPVGQTFRNFEFPIYQEGKLRATLFAVEAKGVTQNRADTTTLTIKIYDKDIVTTTITSPKADLYVNERKMRTKDTVLIVRPNQEATSQSCDFDLTTKKYLMRTNVRVILKNLDLSKTPATGREPEPLPAGATAASTPAVSGATAPAPASHSSVGKTLPEPSEASVSTLPPAPASHPHQ